MVSKLHLSNLRLARGFVELVCLVLIVAAVQLFFPSPLSAQNDSSDQTHVLALVDGSIGYGKLLPNAGDGQLTFSVDGFKEPFHFLQSSVRSVRRVPTGDKEMPAQQKSASWLFRLKDRQQIVGEIQSLTAESLIVLTEYSGEIVIPRDQLLRIERNGQSGELVKGIVRADEWKDPNQSKAWKLDATRINSTAPGTRIYSDFSLPIRSEIRLSIRWSRKPNFAINFGVDAKNNLNDARVQWGVPEGHKLPVVGKKQSFASLETWTDELAFVRESGTDSKLMSLGALSGNSLDLTLYLDIKEGLAVAQTSDGKLHKLSVPSKLVAGKLQAIEIQNFGGGVSVENFEISKWSGQLPIEFADKSGLVKKIKGEEIEGVIDGWDAQSNSWILKTADEVTSLPKDELAIGTVSTGKADVPIPPADVSQSEESQADSNAKRTAEADLKAAKTVFVCVNGTRINGSLRASKDGALQILTQYSSAIISIPTEQIREISNAVFTAKDASTTPAGLLAITGLSEIQGALVEDIVPPRQTSLVWQPTLAINASELDYDRSGEIRSSKYIPKETVVVAEPEVTPEVQQPLGGGILRAFGIGGVARPVAPVENTARKNKSKKDGDSGSTIASGMAQIRFRSGDSTPAKIVQINESGVRFESERTSTTFAPDSVIDQIVFRTLKKETITADQRKRLLTVPRAQQNDPPTHLLISAAGDFLRGRLVEVNQKSASVEVRGEIFEFPTEELAEIVWLYTRDWKTPKEKTDAQAQTESNSAPTEVYIVLGKDQGMAILPEGVSQGVIIGKSALLGESKINLPDLISLYWGPNTSTRARELRNQVYSLTLAQMPRDNSDSAAGGASGANAHPLVGKPAPEFALKNLAGDAVQLKSLGGQIVVLDFWASWCGPCMQSMPQLEQMMDEFDQSRVKLLAINIQEPKAKIDLALNRMKIDPEVLLDVDGEIAAAYAANAIPQTVIIDPTGTVSHVFVGGGNQVLNQIRQALATQLEVTRN